MRWAALLAALAAPAAAQTPLAQDAVGACLSAPRDLAGALGAFEAQGWSVVAPADLTDDHVAALAAASLVNHVVMTPPSGAWPGIWERQVTNARGHRNRVVVEGAPLQRRFLVHTEGGALVDLSTDADLGRLTCVVVAAGGPPGAAMGYGEARADAPVGMIPIPLAMTTGETQAMTAFPMDAEAISEAVGAPFPFTGIVTIFRAPPS